ncbi:hypothetical protein DPMN_126456 [Dreissena polymorpha]|uniref:Transmembrane protein n=1 Tax=Dreissena polymorpha TaxID=45954 RepID=A0A9D4GW51_DREPO|nr:hypothetical protein DPMN_126456 [Dreissena polymorpha]
MIRRSGRLYCTYEDCLGVSCRCQGGLGTVSDCLFVSCLYLNATSGQSSALLFMSRSFFVHVSAVLNATPHAFMAATISSHFFCLFSSVTNGPSFPSRRFVFSITSSKMIYIYIYLFFFGPRMSLTLIVAVCVFHFSRVFSPSDVDDKSGNVPKNSDYQDRSRLTTPSYDHSRGNLLLDRDEWSVGGRLASVDHTVNRL